MKLYDCDYYRRWYHDPGTRILLRDSLERKVAVALAAAEFVLGRRVGTVLDVGCGEAPWRAVLRRMRPGLRYLGVDGSEYVVRRHGRRRGIRLARFGELASLGLKGRFDLVVCSDVHHYVPARELAPGIATLGSLTGGLAWIEVFAAEDETVGDHVEYHERPAAAYQRLLRRAKLTPIGLYCFVPRDTRDSLTSFELGRV